MTIRARRVWFALIVIMSAVNLAVFGSAALNLDWVLSGVAHGQYESLPAAWRVGYLALSILMVVQVSLARRLLERGGAWSPASAVGSMLLVLFYVLSTVLYAISPTNDERWNAIPAVALMVAFFMLRGPEDKQSV